MKKILILLVFIFSCVQLFSQEIIIPRTKTTSESEFSNLKNACHTPGHIINYYYDLPENRDGEDVYFSNEVIIDTIFEFIPFHN